MASLQSSCSILHTNPNPRISQSSPNLINPSHLLLHSRRSHRPLVSCSGGTDPKPSSEGRVDRRNMLLGLGGLYGGATSLITLPKSHATPIQPPEFKTCGSATDVRSGDPLDVNCCPPFSDNITDYKLPLVKKKLRMRPAAHKLDREYLAKYEEAIRRMKELDTTDPTDPRGFTQQANIHCAYCNGAHDQVGHPGLDLQVHNSWLFFPFHRWYLYFYERILGELIGDDTFALPFWNWDNPKGMQIPKPFDNPNSPLFNKNRNQKNRPPAIVNLSLNNDVTDDIQKVVNNLSVMYNEMVRSISATTDFMGKPYRAGDNPGGFGSGGASERGSHTGIHAWVGDPRNKYSEDMGNFYSAGRDTAFYSHHANVDRMWAVWTGMKTDVPKTITDPDYLNAAFLFYDEKKRLVRVKVSDAVDCKKMGYEYEKIDTPWLNYRPPKKAAAAKIEDLSKGVKTAEKVFPLTLKKTTRVVVKKTARGKADEVLVLENIETDPTKLIKFDVFVNDEDDEPKELDKAEYAGTFAQLPHRVHSDKSRSSINLSLKELYEDIDIGDDDTLVVTIIPRSNGKDVTIGGIKIVAAPAKSA